VKFAIRFDFPGADPVFAGMYKGAAGFAPTLATAKTWGKREDAVRFLTASYGSSAGYGTVVPVTGP